MFVENDIKRVKFFEMNRLIDKRQIKRQNTKYLLR